VRHVEDAERVADRRVFFADRRELDGHLPPAEIGELRAAFLVDLVERGASV